MGLFKDLKNMKDTVHAAPDMIRQAQEMGAQAQALGAAQAANPMVGAPGVVTAAELEPIAGVSLELYAQWAKTVGVKKLDQAGTEAFVQSQGFPATAWQEAYDGWNARMKNNMALSVQYGNLYQQAVAV